MQRANDIDWKTLKARKSTAFHLEHPGKSTEVLGLRDEHLYTFWCARGEIKPANYWANRARTTAYGYLFATERR